jgi:mannose-6-phosphate isomerase-like protein (cupin superfamily)
METTFIPKVLIDETLSSKPAQGKRELEPLKSFSIAHGVPLHILEDTDVISPGEVHANEADLWICISGEVIFTCGGTLTGDVIEGGTEYVLHEGDVLHIPAGIPHAHRSVGTARLYIIKVPLKNS